MRELWYQLRDRAEHLTTPREYVIAHGQFEDTPAAFAAGGMPFTKQFVSTDRLLFTERAKYSLVDLTQLGDPTEFTTRATFFLDSTTQTASRFVHCEIWKEGRELEELRHLAILDEVPTYEVRDNLPRSDGSLDYQLILRHQPLWRRVQDRLQRRIPLP